MTLPPFQQEYHENDKLEDTETTQVFTQHAAVFDSTTVEEAVPHVMPKVTQNKLKEMVPLQSMTAEASVHRKTIAPHQIHYVPLDTMYVVPVGELPVGGTREHRAQAMPYKTATFSPSDLIVPSGKQHDFISEACGAMSTST